MTEPLELLVIEGQKNGARTRISDTDVTSVGNDYDCDVMLGLPGVEHALALPGAEKKEKLPVDYPKLEMKQHEGNLLVRVVRGNVQVGQKTLSEGGQAALQPDTPVTLGNSVFVVGPSSALPTVSSTTDSVEDASQGHENANQDTEAGVAINQGETDSADAETKPKKRGISLMNAVAALCVVVGGVVAFVNYEHSGDSTQPDASETVSAQLEQAGYTGLTVSLLDGDTVLVNGFMESRAELYEARSLLQTSTDALVEWDVKLGETLVDSVQSVFQVNGVAASVESVSSGSVLVQTETDDLALLERIKEIAYADVADLEHLELANTVPVVAEVEEEPKNVGLDSIPGKRIVMIMAGEYIKTEDGSVYYQGSILPSGHKVLAILDKKIQVEFNDEQTELTF